MAKKLIKATIIELKKNDIFVFNHTDWRVIKKYRNDDSPLKAVACNDMFNELLFHHEGLEVELVKEDSE